MATKNCGLLALDKIVSLKSTSMFTLIQLAKDNGVNLYFCKVEPDEIMKVARPAILHEKDHFVYIEDGQAIPPGNYDGYVLTPKPFHDPLSHSLAKTIRGQKESGGIIGNVFGGISTLLFGKKPKLNSDPVGNYQQASKVLASGESNPLLASARTQIQADLNRKYDRAYFENDTGYQNIQSNKQKAIDALMAQYANYGQDPYSSTEAQRALSEINNQYDQTSSEYMQGVEMQKRQQALANSMQQGQFDYESAMELATQLGRKSELEYAIKSNNYNQMQKVVGGLLTAGVGIATKNPLMIAKGASSMFATGGSGDMEDLSSLFSGSSRSLRTPTQSSIPGMSTKQYLL